MGISPGRKDVSFRCAPPLTGETQMSPAPERSETKAIFWPSGETRASIQPEWKAQAGAAD